MTSLHKLTFATVLTLNLILLGCGTMLPSTRTESAATKTADSAATKAAVDFVRTTSNSPPPAVTMSFDKSGKMEKFEVGASPPAQEHVAASTTSNQRANSTEMLSSKFEMSIPWGVSLILLAVGILAVLYAIKTARKSSVAVNAAYEAADQQAADTIRKYKTQAHSAQDKAVTSSDPAEMARLVSEVSRLNASIAEMEADRGKMLKKKIDDEKK